LKASRKPGSSPVERTEKGSFGRGLDATSQIP
jgi:hypothetical protein